MKDKISKQRPIIPYTQQNTNKLILQTCFYHEQSFLLKTMKLITMKATTSIAVQRCWREGLFSGVTIGKFNEHGMFRLVITLIIEMNECPFDFCKLFDLDLQWFSYCMCFDQWQIFRKLYVNLSLTRTVSWAWWCYNSRIQASFLRLN